MESSLADGGTVWTGSAANPLQPPCIRTSLKTEKAETRGTKKKPCSPGKRSAPGAMPDSASGPGCAPRAYPGYATVDALRLSPYESDFSMGHSCTRRHEFDRVNPKP